MLWAAGHCLVTTPGQALLSHNPDRALLSQSQPRPGIAESVTSPAGHSSRESLAGAKSNISDSAAWRDVVWDDSSDSLSTEAYISGFSNLAQIVMGVYIFSLFENQKRI